MLLLLVLFLVFVFDIICCWLIYTAVSENDRHAGWGPKHGEADLLQHPAASRLTGAEQDPAASGR